MSISELKSILPKGTAALIISEHNRDYFTSFKSSSGYLLVTGPHSVFITDSRYIEEAKNKVRGCDEILLQKDFKEQLMYILKSLQVKKVQMEASHITVKKFEKFKEMLKGIEVTASGEIDEHIESLRSVKSQGEKEKIKKAQGIAQQAFMHILEYIKPGKTERQIALELDYFMLGNGASALSFDTIVVSGKNSSKPHGVPSEKKIETGDFITMDFGACFLSYHSDMTRTVAVGSVSEKQALVYDIVQKAQLNAISKVREGALCKDCDFAAREVISDAGYADNFGHSTGHGVGIELHENPNLTPSSDEVLKAGNVVTVEPGIYIENEFGVRIEDMVFVTPTGCENLTNSPKNLMVL
ncbi:MAG: aminopeptidase P family protein [Oscillospiraceae bacterium]|nr:aminopeptidase P family protein [Oscillospiraceae bacterium]